MWAGGGCEGERETIGEVFGEILSGKEGSRRHCRRGGTTVLGTHICY